MKEVTYLTGSNGKKVAAVVPIEDWKQLKPHYRTLKKDEEEEKNAPVIGNRKKPLFVVRKSKIHGRGVFAATNIKKGTPIIEYKGKLISQDEADNMAADDDNGHHHTVLFSVDDDMVIDASRKGNEARFINHSCDPNCETIQYGRRIFIEAIRNIKKDEELSYDYHLQVEKPHTKKKLSQYVCHCGAKNCRGTQVDLG